MLELLLGEGTLHEAVDLAAYVVFVPGGQLPHLLELFDNLLVELPDSQALALQLGDFLCRAFGASVLGPGEVLAFRYLPCCCERTWMGLSVRLR